MANSANRLVIWVFNCILAVLAVLSISCYFMGPFWEIKINMEVTPDNLTEITSGQDLPLSDKELKEIIGEEGVKISLPLTISTKSLFDSFGSDAAQIVTDTVNYSINNITSQLLPAFGDILKRAVPVVGRRIIKDQVSSLLVDAIASASTSEEAQQKMEEAGVTNEFISSKLDDITAELSSDNATVDSVTNTVMNAVDEVTNKLNNSDDPELQDFAISEEQRQDIENTVRDRLADMASEDGKINVEDFINGVLSSLLNGSDEDDANVAKVSAGTVVFAAADDSVASTTDGGSNEKTDLSQTIADFLRAKLPAETANMISLVFKITAGIIFFSMAMWLFVLVKIIIKLLTRAKNPTVKLKSVIWLGWLPFLILVLVPTIAMKFVMPMIADGAGLPAGLSITFSSISIISALCAAAALIISIIYMPLRRKIRRQAQ